MVRQIWQWLKQLFQRLLGMWRNHLSVELASGPASPAPPLSEIEYEHYFLQLLEGVNQGWDRVQIARFFQELKYRATMTDWLGWLERFDQKLMASPVPNHELARRLLQLSENAHSLPSTEAIAVSVHKMGTELLARVVPISETDLVTEPPTDSVPAEKSDRPPESADDWFKLGVEQLDHQDYEGALESFNHVVELNIYDHRAWTNLGTVLSHCGRLSEAVTAYDHALSIKPDFLIVWNNRGDVLFDLHRIEEAIASYDQALALESQQPDTWSNRALALANSEKWEEAIKSWERALEFKPEDWEIWFNRGLAFGMLEKWEEAIGSWDQALELKPDLQDAWVNKGIALQKLGRWSEAIIANQRAIAIGSDA